MQPCYDIRVTSKQTWGNLKEFPVKFKVIRKAVQGVPADLHFFVLTSPKAHLAT